MKNQQHAARFIAYSGASTGCEPPRFIKDELDALLECGILAHGFPRLCCNECGHAKLLAFMRHMLDSVGLKNDEGHGSAVMLIQHFGSAATATPPWRSNTAPWCRCAT